MSELISQPRIAFQGERGAFSEEAAVALLGEGIKLVPRPSFEALFSAVSEGIADHALAPLENSLIGSIGRAYDLLVESGLQIEAEVVIPIAHQLIGCRGAAVESIKVVESHPVALSQCERFFAAHPHIVRVAADDTAASVRRVIERRDPRHAAIAGMRAARTYEGTILAEHLEDDPENYTRFALLTAATSPHASERADKLTLAIRLSHQPGALHRALDPFARRGIDLLKIESRPVKGHPWEYRIYLDLQASTNDGGTKDALGELRERATEVRLLGCYPSARNAHRELEA